MSTSSFQNKLNELERRLKAENKSRERDRARPHEASPNPRRPTKPCNVLQQFYLTDVIFVTQT